MNKTLYPEVIPQKDSDVESILQPIFQTGQITRSDQQKLLSLTLSNPKLLPQEMRRINQVIFSVQSGQLKVVD